MCLFIGTTGIVLQSHGSYIYFKANVDLFVQFVHRLLVSSIFYGQNLHIMGNVAYCGFYIGTLN